jgi:hypothetical protein
VSGDHSFTFLASKVNPGHTTFTQKERFSGAISWLMGEGILARSLGVAEMTRKNWGGFNRDFMAWCERGKVGGGSAGK